MRSGFFLQKTAYPFFLQKNLAVCVAWITFAMRLHRNRGSASDILRSTTIQWCCFCSKKPRWSASPFLFQKNLHPRSPQKTSPEPPSMRRRTSSERRNAAALAIDDPICPADAPPSSTVSRHRGNLPR